MKKSVFFPILIGLTLCTAACSRDTADTSRFTAKQPGETEKNRPLDHKNQFIDMRLNLITDKGVVQAQLYDNPAARDFIAMLPLALTLDDFNKTEKIATLPARLSSKDAPEGYTPKKGDLAFYVPWGNLSIFYRDFRYSPGLLALGKMEENGMSTLEKAHTVTINVDSQK